MTKIIVLERNNDLLILLLLKPANKHVQISDYQKY